MMNKVKIEKLTVRSFVTNENKKLQTLKGGGVTCTYEDSNCTIQLPCKY